MAMRSRSDKIIAEDVANKNPSAVVLQIRATKGPTKLANVSNIIN